MTATLETTTQPAAFAELFGRHYDEALHLAYQLCGDWHRAEDIAADVFAKCYQRWRNEEVAHPRAYLRRAVVNEVNSRFRRLAVERREARTWRAEDCSSPDTHETYADRDLLRAVLRQLPARQRAAVVLRYYEDLPERDAAAALGISVGTVKSSTSRALKRMATLLAAQAA